MSEGPAQQPAEAVAPSRVRFSAETRALLRIAATLGPLHERKLKPARPEPVLISCTSLLGALLFGTDLTSRWFRGELPRNGRAVLSAALGLAPSAADRPLPGVPPEDDPRVLDLTEDIWSRTASSAAITASVVAETVKSRLMAPHHLIYMVLASNHDLRKFHVTEADLRQSLFEHVAYAFPSEVASWPNPPTLKPSPPLPKYIAANLSPGLRDALHCAQTYATNGPVDLQAFMNGCVIAGEAADDPACRLLRQLAVAASPTSDLLQHAATRPTTSPEAEPPFLDRSFLPLFRQADDLRISVLSPDLWTGHVIAAALADRGRSGPGLASALKMLNTSAAKLGQELFELETETLSFEDEKLDLWSRALRGRPLGRAMPAKAKLAADTAPAKDLLNFETEARAFALVASDPDLEPPISIGLFGDWGSGKSFFMDRMRAHVRELDELTTRVEGGPEPGPKPAPKVAQIEFNAWHYASGDIYASLAHRIFSELQRIYHGTDEEEAVAQMLDKLEWALAKREDLTQKMSAAEKDLRDAKDAQESREKELNAKQLEVSDLARKAAETLFAGVDDKTRTTVVAAVAEVLSGAGVPLTEEEKGKLSTALQGSTFSTAKDRLALFGDGMKALGQKTVLRGIFAVAACIVVVAVLLAAPLEGALAKLKLLVAAPLGVAGYIWAKAGRVIDRVFKVTEASLAGLSALEEGAKAARASRDAELRTATEELETAMANLATAKSNQLTNETTVAELHGKLDAGLRERQLARLVDHRIREATYSKHLGVVETLRDDFDKLSVLLRRKEGEERLRQVLDATKLERATLPKQINRIVLYIDDLDRCPANKVADVMQAIHLFLAFPLFVVVAAIDARWAWESIRETFPKLGPGGAGNERSATPADYLEKIFQIPFWIRPMNQYGAKRVLAQLWKPGPGEEPPPEPLPPPLDPEEQAEEQEIAAAKKAKREGDPATTQEQPDHDEELPAEEEEVVDLEAVSLAELQARQTINNHERSVGASLVVHIGSSPRRLKRFANIYRLVKSSMSQKDWGGFDADDQRAVLTLLAVLVGVPNTAPALLRELRKGPLADAPPVPHAAEDADTDRARKLLKSGSRDLFLKWVPLVERYSFRRDTGV